MSKLVKVTCELRFQERLRLLAGFENIYRSLLGKEPEDAGKWLIPGLRIQNPERRETSLIDAARSVIDIEEPPNVGFCKDSILRFFKILDDEFSIPAIGRWGLRSTWIQEYDGDFESVLAEYKTRFFHEAASLVQKAHDAGLTFEYSIDKGRKLTVTTGPMNLDQMKAQFLTYPPKAISPVFLYTDVDMGDTTKREYSPKYLADFILAAVQEGERLMDEVVGQMQVEK